MTTRKLSKKQRDTLEAIYRGCQTHKAHGSTLSSLERRGLITPSWEYLVGRGVTLTEAGEQALGVWKPRAHKDADTPMLRFARWVESVLKAASNYGYLLWEWEYRGSESIEVLSKKAKLEVTWTAGGMTGGGHWGGKPDRAVDPDEPRELTSLDQLLFEVCPDLSFLRYRALTSDLIETGSEDTCSDYYGNSHIEAYKRVPLYKLYDAFRDNGWLPEGIK